MSCWLPWPAQKDFRQYEGCVQAITEMSPDAKIFALVHKMDVIPEASRDEVCACLSGPLCGFASP